MLNGAGSKQLLLDFKTPSTDISKLYICKEIDWRCYASSGLYYNNCRIDDTVCIIDLFREALQNPQIAP